MERKDTLASATVDLVSNRRRYAMLCMFFSLIVANSILWISFAAIAPQAESYFDVSGARIDFLSTIFLVLYPPGTLLASFVVDRFGTRAGAMLGAACNVTCALLRYLVVVPSIQTSSASWWIVLLGQSIGALGQPVLLNLPARMAREWFPADQRSVATMVCSMGSPIGIAIGQVVPSLLVVNSYDVQRLFAFTLVFSLLTSLATFIFFRRSPPTPPSYSCSVRRKFLAMTSPHQIGESLRTDIVSLLKNRDFLALLLGFGISLANFNAIMTLITRVVNPAGYGSEEAGLFGGLVIGCGLLSAIIFSIVLDTTKAFGKMARIIAAVLTPCAIFLVLSIQPDRIILAATGFSLLGLFALPFLPVALECAAECTFPVPEETSSGMLMMVGNVLGIAMIFAGQRLLELSPIYGNLLTPFSAILVISQLIASGVVVFFFHGQTLRIEAEEQN